MTRAPFTRSLLALALLAAGTAQAQSSLTLFGLTDIGLNNVTGQNAANTRLSSGIMEGSRWGMKGSEDLGGGYKAVFVLESRVELDTGANSNRAASGSQLPDRFTDPANFNFPLTLADFGLSPAQFAALPVAQQQQIGAFITNTPAALAARQGLLGQVGTQVGSSIGVNLDNRLFDRQAFVGLVTPVGAILMGRQYTPGYEMFYVFDSMQTESSLSAAQIATLPPAIDIRRDNTVAYRVQQNGFTGTLSLSFGERTTGFENGRYLGGNFYYKGADWGAGIAYAHNTNTAGETALRNLVLGAYVDVGPGRLSTLVATAKDDNPEAAVGLRAALAANAAIPTPVKTVLGNGFEDALRIDANLFHVGYRIQSGPHQVTVAYNHFHDKLRNDADTQSYGAVYTYAFSKRTDVNFVLTQFRNQDQAQAAPGGNGFFGGVTSEAGRDARNVAIALRHRF